MQPVIISNSSKSNFNINNAGSVSLPYMFPRDVYGTYPYDAGYMVVNTDLQILIPLQGAQSISLQTSGTWSGSITISASIDKVTWVVISLTDMATMLTLASISSNSLFASNVGAFAYLKVDASGATGEPDIMWTTGDMQIVGAASGGGGAGDASAANQLSTLAAINNAKTNAISVWTDDTGAYFIRQTIMNTQTGAETFQYRNPVTNAIVSPGAGLKPPATSSTTTVTQNKYTANNSGVGFAAGNTLVHTILVDNSSGTPVVLANFWVNETQGTIISAPLPADIATSSAPTTISTGVTKINRSGTITTGGAAQVLMVANPARRGVNIQNLSNQDLWVSQVGTASAGPGSIRLKPDGYYEPYMGVAVGAISIFGATTGQQFTAYEF